MSGARVRVLEGGEPSPEELAALVVALTPARTERPEEGAPEPRSGWRRAALLESVGRTRYASAPDVRAAFAP